MNPYLSFNGNCEEAINYYKEALNGTIEALNYMEGSPIDVKETDKKK
jgi:PhnB protein